MAGNGPADGSGDAGDDRGGLESENHLDSYNRVFKEAGDMQFKFSDAELALDAITGGNADLALNLVDRHVIGRGYRWGYRRATDHEEC